MKLVNCTPHPVTIFDDDGKTIVLSIPPSGEVARVSADSVVVDRVGSIPITSVVYGEVVGLPSPKEDTMYIVSGLVASAAKGQRDDLLCPNTNPSSAVREDGRTVGVKALTKP